MSVTEAVVLAAGRGSRLGALTEHMPKPLLDVQGQPMLLRILRALAEAGIETTIVVTGYLGDMIAQRIGNTVGGMRVQYVDQSTLNGTAPALVLARGNLPGSFVCGWGDIVVEAHNYGRVVDVAAANPAASVIAVNEVDDPSAGGAVYLDANLHVTRLVEKPPPGTSTTRWNNAGISVLQPSIWGAIAALAPSARGEYELPRAIAALVEAGDTVLAVPVSGPWFDAGTPESLAAARTAFPA